MRLPLIMLLLCYLVLVITDLLIIFDLRRLSLYSKYGPQGKGKQPEVSPDTNTGKKRRRWWKVYLVFSILVMAVLTVAICLPRRSASLGVTPTMWLLYIVLTVEFAQIVYCIFSLIGFLPKVVGRRRWDTGLWIGLPMAVLVFCMMWWGAIFGRYRIETEAVDISSPRLPASFEGYKIAQISDLHVGTWGQDTAFVSKLVDKVNALHPDLIVFTGDLVNRLADESEPFIKPLSRLRAPDGVVTILGNHDYGDYVQWNNPQDKVKNLEALKQNQHAMGWKMLDNTHCSIKNNAGDSIIIIGVGNWGEPPFSQYGDLNKAYSPENHNDDNFKVLLSHNPEHWNREVSHISNIDLTLAGHTHAMQIMFSLGDWRWSPAKFKYDQWGGMYSRANKEGETTHIYVNIGAGEVGIPMRIGADPEITLITLHKAQR